MILKISSDNDMEFKNQLFTDVATQLEVEHKVLNPNEEFNDFTSI